MTRRRNDATDRLGILGSPVWDWSDGWGSGDFPGVVWVDLVFLDWSCGAIPAPRIHWGPGRNIEKRLFSRRVVASLCKSQGDHSEGREGREGGGDDTTTRRRDEKAGIFRVLVLGCESRLRLRVVWVDLVFLDWSCGAIPAPRIHCRFRRIIRKTALLPSRLRVVVLIPFAPFPPLAVLP